MNTWLWLLSHGPLPLAMHYAHRNIQHPPRAKNHGLLHTPRALLRNALPDGTRENHARRKNLSLIAETDRTGARMRERELRNMVLQHSAVVERCSRFTCAECTLTDRARAISCATTGIPRLIAIKYPAQARLNPLHRRRRRHLRRLLRPLSPCTMNPQNCSTHSSMRICGWPKMNDSM